MFGLSLDRSLASLCDLPKNGPPAALLKNDRVVRDSGCGKLGVEKLDNHHWKKRTVFRPSVRSPIEEAERKHLAGHPPDGDGANQFLVPFRRVDELSAWENKRLSQLRRIVGDRARCKVRKQRFGLRPRVRVWGRLFDGRQQCGKSVRSNHDLLVRRRIISYFIRDDDGRHKRACRSEGH